MAKKKKKQAEFNQLEIVESDMDEAAAADRLRYIQLLYENQRYSIGKLDDQILYISSGALALSLTFIKDLVPLHQAIYLWLLFGSWILLTCCIGISLYSHLHSYNAHQKQIDRLDRGEELEEDKVTSILNVVTMVLLILGIALQVLFSTINLIHMPKQDSGNQQAVKTTTPHTSSENLGMPVAKAPKSLKPATATPPKSNK